jgi:hypothetical protein
MALKPSEGHAWNPLRKLSRNRLCPCLSGKKFKACCLNSLPPVVTAKEAEIYKKQMLLPDLIFLTKANEEKTKHLVAEQIKENECKSQDESKA